MDMKAMDDDIMHELNSEPCAEGYVDIEAAGVDGLVAWDYELLG